MQKLRALMASFLITALLASNGAAAAEPGHFAMTDGLLDVQDAYIWNDVSGALQFCDEETLRASFHNRLSQRRFGKAWTFLSDTERGQLNTFITFANGVWRGLESAPLTPSQKSRICTDAVRSAEAFIAAR